MLKGLPHELRTACMAFRTWFDSLDDGRITTSWLVLVMMALSWLIHRSKTFKIYDIPLRLM